MSVLPSGIQTGKSSLLRNSWILPEFPGSVYLNNISENSVFCITFHSQLYSQRGNKKQSFVLAGADTWRHLIILPDIHAECLSTLSFRSIVRSNNGAFGDVGAMHHCIQFTYNFFYLLSSLQCETRTKLWYCPQYNRNPLQDLTPILYLYLTWCEYCADYTHWGFVGGLEISVF